MHLMNKNNKTMPTALIPFCSFMGNMDLLGQQMEGFSVPVCTAFEPTLFMGRQCYSLDINAMIGKGVETLKSGKDNGLTLFIDLNEERHFGNFLQNLNNQNNKHKPLSESTNIKKSIEVFIDSLETIKVVGGGNIAISSIKEITGDDEYLEYSMNSKSCQQEDTRVNCSARSLLKQLQERCACAPYHLHSSLTVSYNKQSRIVQVTPFHQV